MAKILTKAEIDTLKARIGAEVARRQYYGNIDKSGESNAATAMIWNNTKKANAADANQIIKPLNLINDIGIENPVAGEKIDNFSQYYINEKLGAFEKVTDVTSSSHGCGTMCTGLCSTTCGNGCGGGCNDNCSGTCQS